MRGTKESSKVRRFVEVELNDQTPRGSMLSESSYNGISADELAAMRARRILLNEKLPGAGTGITGHLNDATFEKFVRGPVSGSVLTASESPLPAFARAVTALDDEFLEVARLLLVLFLRLTMTVEHVVSLRLWMISGDEMYVEFTGIRARAYSNVDPTRIEVSGTCCLEVPSRSV